jgi:hypothetical protein
LLTADLLQTIRATNIGAREREVAQLLEISPTPRPLPWLEPALNYTFIQAFLQLTTEAAGDNPTTTLRRALGPQGFSRLAKRQHIGSVKNLNAAARALRLEWWRDAFTQVIDHPTPTCYPGPQCDPTNPLPDFQERQRRLEMTLAPLLQVPH